MSSAIPALGGTRRAAFPDGMHGHFVFFATLLVQADVPLLSLGKVVTHIRGRHRPDAAEGVDHHADQGAVEGTPWNHLRWPKS